MINHKQAYSNLHAASAELARRETMARRYCTQWRAGTRTDDEMRSALEQLRTANQIWEAAREACRSLELEDTAVIV
jgi:hypothetical protein